METLIFLDTCSLLVASWDISAEGQTVIFNSTKDKAFWNDVVPTLALKGKVIITKRNYDELVKLSRIRGDSKRPLLGERCDYALKKIVALLTSGEVSVVGDANDPFADAILLSVALKFRTQKNLLFVTQDKALACDLHTLSLFQSVRPRNDAAFVVKRVNRSGGLSDWSFHRISERPARDHDKSVSNIQTPIRMNTPQHAESLNWWEV